MSLVGAKVLRKEDPRLLTGTGTFVDDLAPSRCAFASFVMSTEAHARIVSIDVRAALRIPGVQAVFTAEDFVDFPDLPGGFTDLERPALARNFVRFVGEPVAVVVADDRYIAADAAQAVDIQYDTLPVVTTIAAATAPGAPLLFPHHGSNVVTTVPMLDDLERELARCDGRAKLHIVNQRCAAVPIEPIACIADWRIDGLTLWATFQAPHHLRNYLSTWLDIPQTRCRVIAPDVGGGFGAKIVWYPEFFIAPVLSKRLGCPVKFAQTRTEAMQQMSAGRDQEHDIEVGYERDGTIKALRLVVSQNLGAYADPTGLGLPVLTTWMAAGAYRIPRVETSFRTVLTNTTPVAAYRGAGRPRPRIPSNASSIWSRAELAVIQPRCVARTSFHRRPSRTRPTTRRSSTTRPTSPKHSLSAFGSSTTRQFGPNRCRGLAIVLNRCLVSGCPVGWKLPASARTGRSRALVTWPRGSRLKFE